jgi:hypothetical protein
MTCDKCGFIYYMLKCKVCDNRYYCGYCDNVISSCVPCSQKLCKNCDTSQYFQKCEMCDLLYCVNCVYPDIIPDKNKKDICWNCYYFENCKI